MSVRIWLSDLLVLEVTKMTIKELAKLAGVSTATVSRALNNATGISDETRKRINDLARNLNYQPNLLAKGLTSQRTYTIAVLVPDIANPFYADIIRGIEDIALSYEYTLVLFNTDYDEKKERRALELFKSGRFDGLITSVSNRVIDECITLAKLNYAMVMLGHVIDEVKCTKIGCNNFSSAYSITEYLIKAGHKKIAHIAGHKETKTGIQRLQGYRRALETYGLVINPDLIVDTDYFAHSAYEKTLELLRRENNITAIFAANDAMAAGCYKAIRELDFRIPNDISVVGHDDTEIATLVYPNLTTMRQERQKIGELAAQNLFSVMLKKENNENVIIVPTTLVERDSVLIIGKKNH